MKEIILEDPELRINTIRHIFGIDKYKQIFENTSLLLSRLREEKRTKEGATETLDRDKLEIVSKEEELAVLEEVIIMDYNKETCKRFMMLILIISILSLELTLITSSEKN